jgi:hypothetical protein
MNVAKPCGPRPLEKVDNMSFTTPQRHSFLDLSGVRICMRIFCAYILQRFPQKSAPLFMPHFSCPPYRSMLFPLTTPAPELGRIISKYLAPTSVVLSTLRESFTSGGQAKFAHRMKESVQDGAPWALAWNVGRKIWGLLSGDGDG